MHQCAYLAAIASTCDTQAVMLIEDLPAGRRINANRKNQTIQYPKPKLYLQCDLPLGCKSTCQTSINQSIYIIYSPVYGFSCRKWEIDSGIKAQVNVASKTRQLLSALRSIRRQMLPWSCPNRKLCCFLMAEKKTITPNCRHVAMPTNEFIPWWL